MQRVVPRKANERTTRRDVASFHYHGGKVCTKTYRMSGETEMYYGRGENTQPLRTSVGRTGVTVVMFREATFFLRPTEFGVALDNGIGRGPERRWPREKITAIRTNPISPYLDGGEGRSLLVCVEGREPIVAVKWAPADDVLGAAAHLCGLLGLPLSDEFKAFSRKSLTLRPTSAQREERAWAWLHPKRANQTEVAAFDHLPVIEYAQEAVDDLRFERLWGCLRISVSGAGWQALWREDGFIGIMAWITMICLTVGIAVPVRMILRADFARTAIAVLPFALLGATVILNLVLSAYFPCVIEITVRDVTASRQGFWPKRRGWRCDEIVDVALRPRLGWKEIVLKLRKRKSDAVVAGPMNQRQAEAILKQLRLSLGLDDESIG